MGIFENENYKVISDFIESKSHILGENREFNRVYILLSKKIEELSKLLKEEDKEKFNEIYGIDLENYIRNNYEEHVSKKFKYYVLNEK